jgi:hypothetical protein
MNSLVKGSISKYFFYALGEIILVVLGILIALYINDIKDIADSQEKQNNHLGLIKEELENNLIILEDEEKTLAKVITNIRELINLTDADDKNNIQEDELSGMLFLPVTRAIEVDYENAAYNEFIASNSIKDIKNDSLRGFLRSWSRRLETFKFQENVVLESLNKTNNFIEVNGSLKTIFDNTGLSEKYFEVQNSTITNSNKNILESKQFQNILIQYLGVAIQLYKKDYPTFKRDIGSIIHLIETDLNK